jgi:hypothetical protein
MKAKVVHQSIRILGFGIQYVPVVGNSFLPLLYYSDKKRICRSKEGACGFLPRFINYNPFALIKVDEETEEVIRQAVHQVLVPAPLVLLSSMV